MGEHEQCGYQHLGQEAEQDLEDRRKNDGAAPDLDDCPESVGPARDRDCSRLTSHAPHTTRTTVAVPDIVLRFARRYPTDDDSPAARSASDAG
jgi:hypothetical protein